MTIQNLIDGAAEAKAVANRALSDAQARQYAPFMALRAAQGKYAMAVQQAERIALLDPKNREVSLRQTIQAANDAAVVFRRYATMPPDDLAEITARELGQPSPRAMKANAEAVRAEQHRKDQIAKVAVQAVANEKWTAEKFVAKLAKRGIYVVPDGSGRIIGRLAGQMNVIGPINEEEVAILRVREKEVAIFLRPARPA
jgi:hypothetical protein